MYDTAIGLLEIITDDCLDLKNWNWSYAAHHSNGRNEKDKLLFHNTQLIMFSEKSIVQIEIDCTNTSVVNEFLN